MKINFNPARRAKRELLATTVLAALASSPMISGAQAQTADPPAAPDGETTPLPPVDVNGGPPESPGEKAGYSAPPVASSAKINVPQFDLPVSIQTVPEQVIVDQNDLSLADALQNISGVRSNSSNIQGYVYNIRGFTTYNVFRNGLMVGPAIPQNYDTSNLDAIEVLKGPASFLFGRADPGGVINRVTKAPLDAPYYSLTQEFGSFNMWRTVVDMTGPVQIPGIADKSVSYRLSGSYLNGGDFVDFINNQNVFLAPSLSWKLDPATTLTVEAEYTHQNAQSGVGQPAISSSPYLNFDPYLVSRPNLYPASIPAYQSFGEPNQPPDSVRSSLISYEFKHRFDNDWAITNRFLAARATITQADMAAVGFFDPSNPAPAGQFDPANPYAFARSVGYQKLTGTNYSANLDLTGKFYVAGVKNDVLIGTDYFYSYYNYIVGGDSGANGYPISVFNPVYGGVPTSAFYNVASQIWSRSANGWTSFSSNQQKDLGVYAQDLISLFDDRLRVLLGGRYDLADVRTGSDSSDYSQCGNPDCTIPLQPTFGQASANFNANPVQHNQAFSPRAGVVFQPVPWISFYGSYTKSFGLPNGLSANNLPLPPEIAEGWEGGVKAQLFDRRLTATLAFFSITKSNILTPIDPNNINSDLRPIGLARSQGVELDLLGKLTDDLSVIGSYSHIDAKIIKDNGGLLGNSLGSYAPDSGSLWLTYAFPASGPLTGWTTGGGVYAASNRWGTNTNTFILPAYARLDAFAKYQFNAGGARWSAQINLKNVANTRYYDSNDVYFVNAYGNERFGVFPGAPRAVTASLRVEF